MVYVSMSFSAYASMLDCSAGPPATASYPLWTLWLGPEGPLPEPFPGQRHCINPPPHPTTTTIIIIKTTTRQSRSEDGTRLV